MHTTALIEELKKITRVQGKNYRYLAEKLDLSEASIKRIMTSDTITLKRVLELCDLLNVRFSEVVAMVEKRQPALPDRLSFAQEDFLAENPKHFIVFILLQKSWSFERIYSEYNFSKTNLENCLLHLDKEGLIELHPDNKVKPCFAANIKWIKNGPIQRLHKENVMTDMFDYPFDDKYERQRFLTWEVSDQTQRRISTKIDQFFSEVESLVELDQVLDKQETKSCAIYLGFRPWVIGLMEKYRR